MKYSLFNVGNGTYTYAEKVAVVTKFDSVKIKKEIANLRDSDNSSKLIDASRHKTVKTVIILDNGMHILSSINSDTLLKRLTDYTGGENEEE